MKNRLTDEERASRPALEERVSQVMKELEERANKLPPGMERDKLMRRIRGLDTSNHLNDWLASPGLRIPKKRINGPLQPTMPAIRHAPK